jgi:hypothetical protein
MILFGLAAHFAPTSVRFRRYLAIGSSRKASTGRNPCTGEVIDLAARRSERSMRTFGEDVVPRIRRVLDRDAAANRGAFATALHFA